MSTHTNAEAASVPVWLLRRLCMVAVVYVLAWTLLPAWLGSSLPLDVVESLSWGQEWQWGYYKHPPLAPSVLHVFYEVFGVFGPYLLSQLCIALTLWAVWRTGLRLLDAQRALIGTVLTMGVAYYNFPAIEFNHNIAQMPLWAGLGYAWVVAMQTGTLRAWLLLGVLAGAGLLTKYSVAVLLLAMGLYMLASRAGRAQLRRTGPWCAVALMLLILAPHGWWLQAAQWLPFVYASERSMAAGGSPHVQALVFPFTQLAAHAPMLVVLAVVAWRSRKMAHNEPLWRIQRPHVWLLVLGLLPMALVVALGVLLGLGLRDMWGSPMWAFSGLLITSCWPAARWQRIGAGVMRGIGLWLLLVTAFMALYMGWGAELRKRPGRVDWPAAMLAQSAQATWQAHSQCPLQIVAGDYWLTGLLSAYSSSRPSVLIDGNPRFSPWVDVDRLLSQGALWVWQDSGSQSSPAPPSTLAQAMQTGQGQVQQGQWSIPWPHAPQGPALVLHWQSWVPVRCQP